VSSPRGAGREPAHSRALVFIGFMGAGKTGAARAVAAELGVRPLDTDEALERDLGMPVERFFDTRGEPEFRTREEELVTQVLDDAQPGEVISLGGGSVASRRVREALRRHRVVWLDVSLQDAWHRAAGRGRPLARDRDRFGRLHAEREALYAAEAHAMLPVGDRGMVRRALPSILALDAAPAETRLLWATSASGDYPVYVGLGLLESGFWPRPGRRFAVTDENVRERFGGVVDACEGAVALPPGEEHKTIASAERVWRALAAGGFARGDDVVALGGGVVGDLAGFCAATYQRGVAVVQCPTTLVAQVDSAYGGKTGVDLPEAKNYVGAYHQPSAVLVDPSVLGGLPAAEVAAGYAEVVKTALIAGGALWERVRGGAEPADPEVVLACARTKLAVVARDERDAGERQVLNLGHTIGHAIETVSGYGRYRHGEAVALGLLAALRLSGQPELRDEVAELLAGAGLPVRLDPEIDAEAVLEATRRDKKRRSGAGVPFVLVEGPGNVRPGCAVPDDDVLAAVRELAA
jgi:shikimate kinase/3-dehydroquinate synthase